MNSPITPDELAALRAAALTAVKAGSGPITIDLDEVGVLDSRVISTLISILRDLREVGAEVTLRTGRQSILDTLRITALDKVFSIDVVSGHAPPVPAIGIKTPVRPRRRRGAAMLTGTLLAAGLLFGSPASAEPQLSPDSQLSPGQIIERIRTQNPDMRSYEARVSVDLHLQSFPYFGEHLDGTTYFKRPDNFEVVFRKVPSFAKGFDKLYSDIDDPSSWDRRFEMSVIGERDVKGHRDLVMRLVQKVRGMIDHEDVAVDPASWHIDEMEWHYYNGGMIAMSQDFEQVGSFSVLGTQHATIRIPFVHAAAEARYSDYQTNVAIDDSVFTKEKK